MKAILNRSACRQLLLQIAHDRWPGKFTRVSQEMLDFLETSLRSECRELVRTHPTLGKTLQIRSHKKGILNDT